MNSPNNHNTDTARLAIAEQLFTIRTLLRLLDPSSPFQPILVGSIDLVAWQAFFGQAVDAIRSHLPHVIAPLPTPAQQKISKAASTLYSLADSVCDAPQVHLSLQAAELNKKGLLPELPCLAADLVHSPAEQELLEKALTQSRAFNEDTAEQLALHRKALEESTHKLIKSLISKNGLLWLLRRKLKTPRRFLEKFQILTDQLESALASPPPPVNTPWNKARAWFAQLAAVVEVYVMPELDAVLQATAARKSPAARSPHHTNVPSRKTIKDAFFHEWDSFLQIYKTVRHFTAAQDAHTLWTLFSGLTNKLTVALIAERVQDGSSAGLAGNERIIEGVARLDHRIIARSLLDVWNQRLVAEDDYALQVALAGLHHLESPENDDETTASGRSRLIFGFSEGTMARWIRAGAYDGVNPNRETSVKLQAEIRRTRRTLEHLRRNQAAFRGRRNWTPLFPKIVDAASNRLWVINPLLAAHPQMRAMITGPLILSANTDARQEVRKRPSRRNRGKRGEP